MIPSTISDWLKDVLTSSGINVSLFTSLSTRSATTSKTSASGLSMIEVIEQETWQIYLPGKGSIRRILSKSVGGTK